MTKNSWGLKGGGTPGWILPRPPEFRIHPKYVLCKAGLGNSEEKLFFNWTYVVLDVRAI